MSRSSDESREGPPQRRAGDEEALHSADVPGAPVEQPDQRPGPLETPAGDAPDAAQVEGLRPELAPTPVDAPGPSVPASGTPASTTEREERADATAPDAEALGTTRRDPIEQMIAREESAAAAEAGTIGGGPPPRATDDDPAMRPVYEAGGGEAEGFEQAEELLVENASHDAGRGNPMRDTFDPEAESDRSGAEYGEADNLPASSAETELEEPGDDQGAGARRGGR